MKNYNVAVLGATGAVGREMLTILEERGFPVAELRPLASSRSAGDTLNFKGRSVPVREACEGAFEGIDIVLGAAESGVAKGFAPAIRAAGAVFVDNSSAFRMDPRVPLVIPEINPADARLNRGVIANPNCTTIVTLIAVNALAGLSPIKAMTVSSYQAVSGAGAGGPLELMEQVKALGKGEAARPEVFPYQIAYNLIPQIGGFEENGYTGEEMKMQNESRKILHLPELLATCTCVRVPVVRSHSVSVTVVTERPVSVEEAKAAIGAAPGCRLIDDPANRRYPMPLNTSGQDTVFVGRIRKDLTNPNGLALWCCGDQMRKGAATNAVQIAELLLER
ncbi:MAG: aspartate-semialdehyde dehydrogenase [Eubacteriales bacterium]|nr:aspartate-semialdehyde dehydrogenase [Eubacteriales bacterium]